MSEANFQIIKLLADLYTSAERVRVMLEAESLESFDMLCANTTIFRD